MPKRHTKLGTFFALIYEQLGPKESVPANTTVITQIYKFVSTGKPLTLQN